MKPFSATSRRLGERRWKPFTSATWWSEGSTARMPSGSLAATCAAASAMAGAVLRATGSTRRFFLGSPFTSFAACFACTGPQTTKVSFTEAQPLEARWRCR